MKSIIQTLGIISSITLILLGVLVFIMPISEAERLIKAMAIIGFVVAGLIIVSIEWWRRDEEEYEERLEKKNQRVRLSTHV